MTTEYREIVRGRQPYYGQHILLSARGCDIGLTDILRVEDFMKTLVTKIDMVAFGEAKAYRFGQGEQVGLSGIQLIETSLISLHTNDMARDLYLDVFSCKDYDEEDVVQHVITYFNPLTFDYQTIFRK